ncbi:hypothetical protein CORC01_14472 [Colletotrichum orchidophilum]|uniref:Uncharacterized protein n=1 Tax=Colletotrichum orchidophilum TaxID=1209926 RepID=A0A1G4AM19_9PEZI|nr:uncharacterized protein CORC01_14472 [Colletotrichum orchidophilum]OHE90230.1 hypothetical protein CORC01_14472 [Colletotrichum orchidophilum]
MSTPNRSLPGWGEPERPSSLIRGNSVYPVHRSFQAISPEIQPKVLAACAWLLLPEETQGRLNLKRRAKQAEVHARQAETNWLATAVRSMEDEAIEFLQSVLLSDDDERD